MCRIDYSSEACGLYVFMTKDRSSVTPLDPPLDPLTSAGGSIKALATRRHAEHRRDRLKVERARKCLGPNGAWFTDPRDFYRAMNLCVE
jgi:hypothetical protein